MSQVLVITLDDTGENRVLTTGELTVGRGQDNDWILADTDQFPAMSRKHCRFDIGPRGPTVTDLGSTNGTSVNGQVIVPRQPVPLRGGDVIEIGLRRLSCEVRDDEAGPAERPVPGAPPGGVRGLSVPYPIAPPGAAKLAATPMFRDPSRREPSDPFARTVSHELSPAQGPTKAATPTRDDAPDTRLPRAPDLPSGQEHPVMRSAPASFGAAGSDSTTPVSVQSTELSPPAPTGRDALAAFLAGAGLPASAGADRSSEQLLEMAGRLFARLADGLRQLLVVRTLIQTQAGLGSPAEGTAAGNPLELAGSAAQLVTTLLANPAAGLLGSLDAIDAGFRDLKAHELAVLEGVRSALEEMMAQCNPNALEQKLESAGRRTGLLGRGRHARLWALYQERYAEMTQSAHDSAFMGRLGDAFRQGYHRKAAEVEAARTPSP